jgi:hypothetical protein
MADEPTTPATQAKTETPQTKIPKTGTPAAGSTASPLPPVLAPNLDTGYTDAGVPTLEGVREKIETRYGTAMGATELAEETPEVRTAAEQYEAQHKAAAEKLKEIRDSMRQPE